GAPGQTQELLARSAGEPAGKGQCGLPGLALELCAVKRSDDGVRIPRRLPGVDDETRLRAAPGGFLELERPAAIVGECLAAEELRVVRGWLVGEEDDDLPLHVNVLVVVPAELRRGDAVADENRFRIELFECLLCPARAGESLLAGD